MSNPSYASLVSRLGEKQARAHMRRIGRKGGQRSQNRTVDDMLADPRGRRVIRRYAREFGTTEEAVRKAGAGNPQDVQGPRRNGAPHTTPEGKDKR